MQNCLQQTAFLKYHSSLQENTAVRVLFFEKIKVKQCK